MNFNSQSPFYNQMVFIMHYCGKLFSCILFLSTVNYNYSSDTALGLIQSSLNRNNDKIRSDEQGLDRQQSQSALTLIEADLKKINKKKLAAKRKTITTEEEGESSLAIPFNLNNQSLISAQQLHVPIPPTPSNIANAALVLLEQEQLYEKIQKLKQERSDLKRRINLLKTPIASFPGSTVATFLTPKQQQQPQQLPQQQLQQQHILVNSSPQSMLVPVCQESILQPEAIQYSGQQAQVGFNMMSHHGQIMSAPQPYMQYSEAYDVMMESMAGYGMTAGMLQQQQFQQQQQQQGQLPVPIASTPSGAVTEGHQSQQGQIEQLQQLQIQQQQNQNIMQILHKPTGEGRYVCDICGHRVHWRSNMARHKRKHTGQKPYLCMHCGLGFSNSSNRRKHEKGCLKKIEAVNLLTASIAASAAATAAINEGDKLELIPPQVGVQGTSDAQVASFPPPPSPTLLSDSELVVQEEEDNN